MESAQYKKVEDPDSSSNTTTQHVKQYGCRVARRPDAVRVDIDRIDKTLTQAN